MNICKRSCARVHAAEKHGERIFNIRTRYVLRRRGACTFPQPRRRRKQRRSFCMSKREVMDDTAFFAQEAAQGAATSRLGVPRPRGRPRKKSCKRESGNDQDLWCAGCRNNRVCRLVDNNVLAAPILYGSSSSASAGPAFIIDGRRPGTRSRRRGC